MVRKVNKQSYTQKTNSEEEEEEEEEEEDGVSASVNYF